MSLEYPIWTTPPDLSVIPTESRSIKPDVSAPALDAPEFVSFPEYRSERVFKFGFAWSLARDSQRAKAFWNAQGGQHGVFLIPTWNRDFEAAMLPAAGDTELAVYVEDYGATLLTDTRLDQPGRYVFCYDLTWGLFVAKVLESADDEVSTLTLEQPFPWRPTREAIFGFAVLVRFEEDDLDWKSLSPAHTKAEIVFRSVRESILTPEDGGLVDGVPQYESLAFTTHAERVEVMPLRRSVAYPLGPENFHGTQNALYTRQWACWPSKTGGFRMLRDAVPGTIIPPDESQGFKSQLTAAVIDTPHVSCSFDQVGYECIAWQHDETTAKIIRWQNGTPTTTTFAGWSPILFFNGLVNIQAKIDGTTDVVCYYIRRGSGAICARFQRDGFAIEYIVGGFPRMPLLLFSATASGLVHTLLGMDDGYRSMTLTVTYPTQPDPPPDIFVAITIEPDAAAGEILPGDLAYERVIIDPPAIQEAAAGTASMADAASIDTTVNTTFAEGTQSFGYLPDVVMISMIVAPAAQQETAAAVANTQDITYTLAAIETSPVQEQSAHTPSLGNIYYGP